MLGRVSPEPWNGKLGIWGNAAVYALPGWWAGFRFGGSWRRAVRLGLALGLWDGLTVYSYGSRDWSATIYGSNGLSAPIELPVALATILLTVLAVLVANVLVQPEKTEVVHG